MVNKWRITLAGIIIRQIRHAKKPRLANIDDYLPSESSFFVGIMWYELSNVELEHDHAGVE